MYNIYIYIYIYIYVFIYLTTGFNILFLRISHYISRLIIYTHQALVELLEGLVDL